MNWSPTCTVPSCAALVEGNTANGLCPMHLAVYAKTRGEQSPTEAEVEVDQLRARVLELEASVARLSSALDTTRGESTLLRGQLLRTRVSLRQLVETLEALP